MERSLWSHVEIRIGWVHPLLRSTVGDLDDAISPMTSTTRRYDHLLVFQQHTALFALAHAVFGFSSSLLFVLFLVSSPVLFLLLFSLLLFFSFLLLFLFSLFIDFSNFNFQICDICFFFFLLPLICSVFFFSPPSSQDAPPCDQC